MKHMNIKVNNRALESSGFTLIEVLFTLVIISVAAAAIARNAFTNISSVNNSHMQINALNLAQSKLNEITSDRYKSPVLQGRETIENIAYSWKSGSILETVTDNSDKFSTTMTQVSVTVNWKDNNNTKSLTVKQNICSPEIQKVQP